ncbi:hypothetical protein XA68_16177 [Ophiocordyceps unilateralis]|uniref:Secretory lipase n=1 Tax=Ophiocordyceps unilateralis TaxID=268505 RepID=A0A2A9P5F9_OPHUN|nr:hypothetical protein XA68_16177 [Ophiocordyceps unilateralis]
MMRQHHSLLSWVAYLALTVVSALTPGPQAMSENDKTLVVPPTRDAFYIVPEGVDTVAPGTILKLRKPPSPLATPQDSNYAEKGYQMLYRTTDEDGSATATVTTVLIPKNADGSKVVSFQSAVHTVTIDCATSFGFLNASLAYPGLKSIMAQVQLLFAQAALSRGWIVLVPDYGGPQAAMLKAKLTEQAVLDGIRAAFNSGLIDDNATVTLWGYSGGGTTTLKAVQAQPSYAPELKLAGAAIGSAPMYLRPLDPTGLLLANKTPYSGYNPILILMYAATRPWLQDLVDKNLKPQYRHQFYLPRHQCTDVNLDVYKNLDILSWFKDTTFLFEVPPPPDDVGAHKIPSQIPIYWYRASADFLVDFDDTSRRLEDFCDHGATITQTIETADYVSHRTFGILGAPDALRWLADRLDGVAPAAGCSNKTIFTRHLDRAFLNLFSNTVQQGLVAALAESAADRFNLAVNQLARKLKAYQLT